MMVRFWDQFQKDAEILRAAESLHLAVYRHDGKLKGSFEISGRAIDDGGVDLLRKIFNEFTRPDSGGPMT